MTDLGKLMAVIFFFTFAALLGVSLSYLSDFLAAKFQQWCRKDSQ